jgi:hypothetical protein
MTGSVALDVVIGLVFIYLLYSLLASIMQELIATWMGLRANVLQQGIVRMLNDGRGGFWLTGRFRSWWRTLSRYEPGGMASRFYSHPLVKYLSEDEFHNKPSFITSQNFSKVLLDLLKDDVSLESDAAKARIHAVLTAPDGPESLLEPETKQFLLGLWMDAGQDITRFKTLLESWFNDMQDRIVGWYKRYVQVFLFGIGMFIALIGNVDTLELIGKLSKDPKLREQVLAQAEAFQSKYPEYAAEIERLKTTAAVTDEDAEMQLKRLKERSDSLNQLATNLMHDDVADVNQLFGLGREFPDKVVVNRATYQGMSVFDGEKVTYDSNRTCVERKMACYIAKKLREKDTCDAMNEYTINGQAYVGMELNWFQKIVYGLEWPTKRNWAGYFFTAMAISLGAPFWFDLLNKLMKVRGSIQPKAEEQKPNETGGPSSSNKPI